MVVVVVVVVVVVTTHDGSSSIGWHGLQKGKQGTIVLVVAVVATQIFKSRQNGLKSIVPNAMLSYDEKAILVPQKRERESAQTTDSK